MQELPRTAAAAPAAPELEEVDPENLHHVSKELAKAITAAHLSNNTYTEELRRTLQHHTIVLKVEDSDNEGRLNF